MVDTSRWDKTPQYPIGTRHVDAAGRVWYYFRKEKSMKIGDKVRVTTTRSARYVNVNGKLAGPNFAFRKEAEVIAMGCQFPTHYSKKYSWRTIPRNDTMIKVCGATVFIHHSHLEPVEPEPDMEKIDDTPQQEIGTVYKTRLGDVYEYTEVENWATRYVLVDTAYMWLRRGK